MGYDLYTAVGDDTYRLNFQSMTVVRQALGLAGVVNEEWIKFRLDAPEDPLSLQLPAGEGIPLFKFCLNESAWLSERECRLLAEGLRDVVQLTREGISPTEDEERLYALFEDFALYCERASQRGGFYVR